MTSTAVHSTEEPPMGLDTVELVMEMEETFGIVFDDLDAERIGTVGQAYRYILGKLELRRPGSCPSAALFYRLRRSLMVATGTDRRRICPSSRIGEFLPESRRRESWSRLGEELGLAMPRLALDPVQHRLAMAIGLATGATFLAIGAIHDGGITLANLAPAVALTSLFAAFGWAQARSIMLAHSASTLPRGCETVRGTIETILGPRRQVREGAARTWHRDEVWIALRDLISEQLGVALDQVTEEKSFVNDFGAD